ncbi:ribose-phosphate pyrophosphokinase [Methanospirillum hungatei JF-1]|jgi:ribose-phosphate pyrophosphokinase|uniref:ribose-phosphate diphosphokinase n=1 Tax=Methanospirillum hungatei JF-1 (strain ATCC 27890 / DSM 864 / NBRC 100397 / JF-1) TaxID=323259 RepID=Q2FQV7_METHJ|nr:ribose-phosphate diphosphokinase [Methanospirillum hungatei]ABD40725.1 ribose-phosphate pyrophosphokinase [Methanospirillum hungatei JF-1]
MKVVSTQRSQVLAGRLATALNIPVIDTRWQKFPDGEIYVRAEQPAEKVIICGSILTSDDLVELLLLKDIYSGSDISLIIPYMGYARQDKQFNSGEPLSARAIAHILGIGVSRVYTVNIHEKSVLNYFHTEATDVSLSTPAAAYIDTLSLENPLILSPDEGALHLGQDVASHGNWDCDYLQKTRISGEQVRIEPKSVPVAGRDVVILDDIISTGGTQATAAMMLYEQGARSIHTVGIHGVLASGAYTRLISAGIASISCSDTVERACSTYSAAKVLAEYL